VAFIELIDDGDAGELFERDRAALGYVPNYTRLFAHRPAVYEAWLQLKDAILAAMDTRRYELATVAAAQRLRSSYCSLAHGKILADRFFEPAQVRDLVVDRRNAGLDDVDVAVLDLAEAVAGDATEITEADVGRLRDLGFSDTDIFDVVVAAAARCFFSKTLDALGALADPGYAELDPELRDVLTVGRPIAES
jgi:uncharacterized peroxidase-related enzyme